MTESSPFFLPFHMAVQCLGLHTSVCPLGSLGRLVQYPCFSRT